MRSARYDPHPPRAAQTATRRVRRRAAERTRTDERRPSRLPRHPTEPVRARRDDRPPPDARTPLSARPHDHEPGGRRRRQPRPATPGPCCVYTLTELDALEAELGDSYGPIVPLTAATGLRPLEATLLERRDVDRAGACAHREGHKNAVDRTGRCRSPAAPRPCPRPAAHEDRHAAPVPGPGRQPDRASTTSAAGNGVRPSRASGIPTPARIYDLRSTVAQQRARRRGDGVRASEGDGHGRPA